VEAVSDARVRTLIESLGLVAHPEGGYYAETYRSQARVRPADGRGERRALTTIYFLPPEGVRSRWHRVSSDEVWHFFEGAPIELLELTPDLASLDAHRLGPLEGSQAPVRVIPAGHWQAARSTGSYTLVGCTVGPGFEFADFTMMSGEPETAARLRATFPEVEPWM
jgi:predicted cupin superfamily sugar epimerase